MQKKNVLVTGGAGFIGSNLVEALLQDDRVSLVRVLDNLSTGFKSNLSAFEKNEKFEFVEGDICDVETCRKAMINIDLISHQAALGSVPRSINDPITTNLVNIGGTLNVFTVAQQMGIERLVYAASSSTYGDSPELPKKEGNEGNPLSPYAVTKLVNEIYADVFSKVYNFHSIGLRYFNIFGPKQNPNGAYAAVIPLFINCVLNDESAQINGDGETSRDFTFVSNAVFANIQALFKEGIEQNEVCNIACGDRTTLNELWEGLNAIAGKNILANYQEERRGDVKHSLADISKAKDYLGYNVNTTIKEGLKIAFDWYKNNN